MYNYFRTRKYTKKKPFLTTPAGDMGVGVLYIPHHGKNIRNVGRLVSRTRKEIQVS